MGCRCNERREAIVQAIKATTEDLKKLADQATVFSKNVVNDLRARSPDGSHATR
jgi:hypothetical protein